MRNAQGTIDWKATEEKASHMTSDQLYGALNDIQKSLSSADEMDLENETTNNGGYYRDESSVYRAELHWREDEKMNATQEEERNA